MDQRASSTAQLLTALRGAITAGDITRVQAQQIRQQMGIGKAIFTKKRPTDAERKAKRRATKAGRKANRGNTKGMKRDSY